MTQKTYTGGVSREPHQRHFAHARNLSHTLWHVLLAAIPNISRAHAAL